MKSKLCFLGLLMAAVLAMSACGASFVVGSSYPDADRYSVGSGEVTGSVKDVVVEWQSGTVEIRTTESDAIRLTETFENMAEGDEPGEELQVHYWLDGTTLRVHFMASGVTGPQVVPQKNLVLELPADALNSVAIDSASADLTIRLPECETVSVDTASGSVQLSLTGETSSVELDTASGDVTVTADMIGVLTVNTASGSAAVSASSVGTVKANTASGNVNLSLMSADEVELDTTSGGLTAVFGVTPARMDVETTSGDVNLTLPADASFTLDVDTASGDFRSDIPLIYGVGTYKAGDGSAKWKLNTTSGDITITGR